MSVSVLIVVTHLLGVGHLARAAAIARAMALRGHRVTLVSGGRPAPLVRLDGVTLVQLAPVHCEGADFSTLLGEDGAPVASETLAGRREALLAALAAAQPDILVTELFPFGRRQLADEFLALLDEAAARRPRPAVVCSIRDVLNPPSKPGRAAEALDRLGRFYDRVLVHGDPGALPLRASWPVDEALERRLVFTGYVSDDGAPPAGAPAAGRDAGSGEVVVSGGGGPAGLPLLRAAAEAGAMDPEKRVWRILVGHGAPAADFEALARAARGAETVIVERARPDFRALLAGAAVSVSQAGYNTILDLAAVRARAVVVPFAAGGEREQGLRAAWFEKAGCLEALPEERLAPAALLQAVDRAARRPRPDWSVRLDGAAASADALEEEAAGARRRAAGWERLEAALDRLGRLGMRLDLWWRDDDCVAPSPALDRLLGLSRRAGAPLALAVVPAAADPALRRVLAGAPQASVIQHGYAHANHAGPEGKKRELGDAPAELVLAELAFGRERLEELFGARSLPILAPPWNRIDAALVPLLPGCGFRGLSTFKPRAQASPAPGLLQVNTHFDPIDWRGSRGLADEGALLASFADHVDAVAEGRADPDEAYGLLTHHLVHDGWVWRFLEELLGRLAETRSVRFVSAAQAFRLQEQ
ncbi:glycosyltransferase [Alsobacter sp. KACC 23698]|uniref:Glycosyltransferase n=1 Tax=Alsobacter sp. KACC 23698 TaxID=3149229 RepID=A0AAU7JHG6_9HYPH